MAETEVDSNEKSGRMGTSGSNRLQVVASRLVLVFYLLLLVLDVVFIILQLNLPLAILTSCVTVLGLVLSTIGAFPRFLQWVNVRGLLVFLNGKVVFILLGILLFCSVALNFLLFVTRTPTVSTSSISGLYGGKQLLLDDPLVSNTDGRWQDTPTNNCNFRLGGYDVKSTHYTSVCKENTDYFKNFVLQVDMSLSSQSECAVLFRVPDTGGGYYFGIDDRGNYEMRTNTPHKPALRQVQDRDNPQSHYELTIVANGSSIDIYINGKILDHFDDSSYSDGHIALAVAEAAPPINQPNTECIFTNLKVWQL